MKRYRPLILMILAAVLAAAAWLLWPESSERKIDRAIETQREKLLNTISNADSDGTYTCPVDFNALQKVNPDIIAWLDIPGTDISYPILCREGDNRFYLSHAENGTESKAGAIYTEDLNTTDLADAGVVIYGHHLRNGVYFGNLQSIYETEKGFKEHQELTIYLPERQIRCRIFAAVPFSDAHLLYSYQFDNELEFNQFVDKVYESRSFTTQLDENARPQFGQQLVILSTCLKNNNKQRYLVLAVAE